VILDRGVGNFDVALGAVNGSGISSNFNINSPGYRRPDAMFDNDSRRKRVRPRRYSGRPGRHSLFALSGEQRSASGFAGSGTGGHDSDKRVYGVDFASPPVEELRAPSESRTSAPFSAEEIAGHDRPEDCWLVVRGNVYDVTSYIPSHPAPRRTITDYCGTDSTQAFETKERGRSHSTDAWQLLESYLIGAAVE